MNNQKLSELREKTGKTLREVGDFIDVHYSTISRWESKGRIPAAKVDLYAEAIGVPSERVRALIGGPRHQKEFVVSSEMAKDWRDEVAMSDLTQFTRFLLITLPIFADMDTWVVPVSPKDLAHKAHLDEQEVVAHWDELMDSGFVSQIGDGEILYVLRLRFPDALN